MAAGRTGATYALCMHSGGSNRTNLWDYEQERTGGRRTRTSMALSLLDAKGEGTLHSTHAKNATLFSHTMIGRSDVATAERAAPLRIILSCGRTYRTALQWLIGGTLSIYQRGFHRTHARNHACCSHRSGNDRATCAATLYAKHRTSAPLTTPSVYSGRISSILRQDILFKSTISPNPTCCARFLPLLPAARMPPTRAPTISSGIHVCWGIFGCQGRVRRRQYGRYLQQRRDALASARHSFGIAHRVTLTFVYLTSTSYSRLSHAGHGQPS